jgi:MFS family permease
MRLGFRAVGSSCYQVFSHLAQSFGANLLAMLLSLPIVLVSIIVAFFVHSLSVVPLGIALLVGALPNPACMGLQTLARELARGDTADFGEQRQGLRMYWRVSLRAWSIAAAIAITCVLNMAFYATQAANPATRLHAVAAPLFVVWTLILFLWLGVHLYVAPLLLAQAEARVLLAYRNAAVIMLSRPVASLTVSVIWLGVLVFTSFTGLATIIGLALAASIQQNTLRLLLPNLLPTQG